jgi:phosphotransferase system  glucose/maltose/N-acetylglucosamine-specific IIC component
VVAFPNELRRSIKWAVLLFLPWIGAVYGAAFALGGLHGWGAVALVVAEAPVLLLQSVLDINPGDGIVGWMLVILIDWAYFWLLALIFRFLLRKIGAMSTRSSPA